MRRLVAWGALVILVLGGIWAYRHFTRPARQPALWQNLPQGFYGVVYVPSFAQSWKTFRHSPLWDILRKSPHLGDLVAEGQGWDSLLRQYPQLFEWLGSRAILISWYPEGPLYLIEAPFLAQIGDWRGTMQKLAELNSWPIQLIEKEGYPLWQLPTGYLAPAGEILAYAEEPTLLIRFLRGENVAQPPWRWDAAENPPWLIIGWRGPDLHAAFSHPALGFLDSLEWCDLHLYLDEERLTAQGTWTFQQGLWTYVSPTSPSIAELCPPTTQLLLTFRLTDPPTFYRKHLFPLYEKDIVLAEKWLGLSFESLFFEPLSGEIAIAQAQQPFLLFRLKDPEAFRKNLEKAEKRLKNRTPLKNRHIPYRGYTLYHVEVKGLFRWLLGKAFKDWEAPYFTQVGEWLAIAQQPTPLYQWIDAYLARQSLAEKSDFLSSFPPSTSPVVVLTYVQPTPSDWLKFWLPSAELPRWQQEVAPWQALTFSLRQGEAATLLASFQLIWKTPHTAAQETPMVAESLVKIPISRDTLLEGPQEEYYPNGVLKRRVTYVEGQLEGEYWEYYPNGIVKVQGFYEQGQKVGRWRYYSSKGELLREENWGGEIEPVTGNDTAP